jgi:hypothetical protein
MLWFDGSLLGIPNLMIESTEERARRYLVENDKYALAGAAFSAYC